MTRPAATLAALTLAATTMLPAPAQAATHSACSITGGNIKECSHVHFAARDGRGIKATSWRWGPGQNGSECGDFKKTRHYSLAFYNGNGSRIKTLYYNSTGCNIAHPISVKTRTNKLTVRVLYRVDYFAWLEVDHWVHHRIVGRR